MPRPINLEKLAEREAAAREKEEEYRKKRQREAKAYHNASTKVHTQRLLALGQLVEERWPEKSIAAIAMVFDSMQEMPTVAVNGQDDTTKRSRSAKKETYKDYSDTVVPPEARDDDPITSEAV